MLCTSLYPLPCPLWDMPILSSSFCLSRSWDLNKICYKSGVPIIENGMIERVSAGHGWASGVPPGMAVDPRISPSKSGSGRAAVGTGLVGPRCCEGTAGWMWEGMGLGSPARQGETEGSDPSLLTPRVSSYR